MWYNWYFEDINKIDITLDKLTRRERGEEKKNINIKHQE